MAEKIFNAFKELSIDYKLKEHEYIVTVEEQNKLLVDLPGKLTKNLFFKDSKKGFFLVTVASDQEIDTKILSKKLNMGKLSLRFATEDILENKLGVKRGSVSPLCVINDLNNEVHFVLDKTLIDSSIQYINCHPLECNKTVSITPNNLMKFTKYYKHEPIIIDFSITSNPSVSLPLNNKKDMIKISNNSTMTNDNTNDNNNNNSKSKEGISVSKKLNFSDWYTETITKSGLIDYYDISGCYILRPWSYEIWEKIQTFLDTKFKSLNVKNCYFPMFVSKDKLMKEKDHVEGFAPEVAWVTKYGESDLKEEIAIRPTSETIMYPAFKNWIRSHRDLPLKLNQWNNVVRWEFKNPTPFIRTREFLWQEGHTAHATKEESDKEVLNILDFYAETYENLLAVPMIKGKKTEKEKFAGGDYTTTIEGFIPATGRGIQAATSHNLGQNFGKMFNIIAEDDNGKKFIPYQNSWGFTTRSIGIMIMIHGDDKGLVLPPRVASIQVIIIPIPFKDQTEITLLNQKAKDIALLLSNKGIRVDTDLRSTYTPGWKYNYWELKGIPLRFEIGPRDLAKNQVRVVRRDNGMKQDIIIDSHFEQKILDLLDTIQNDMLKKATAERDACIEKVYEWKDFVPVLHKGFLALTPFCNETIWEEKVKEKSRNESLVIMGLDEEAENTATSAAAKTLCIPFKENKKPLPKDMKCFISGKPATCWMLWGRSY